MFAVWSLVGRWPLPHFVIFKFSLWLCFFSFSSSSGLPFLHRAVSTETKAKPRVRSPSSRSLPNDVTWKACACKAAQRDSGR